MALSISWQISKVGTAGYSTWSSVAFSRLGQVAVAYHSSSNRELRFATLNADGTWAVETVDASSGDCAPHLRYRFSQPAVSYAANQQELRYALKRGVRLRGRSAALQRADTPTRSHSTPSVTPV